MINTGNDINIFECEGNLNRDIEFRQNNGKEIAFFSVFTCRKLNDEVSISDRHSFVVKGAMLKNEELNKLKKGVRVHCKGVLTYFKREGQIPSAEIQCTEFKIVK